MTTESNGAPIKAAQIDIANYDRASDPVLRQWLKGEGMDGVAKLATTADLRAEVLARLSALAAPDAVHDADLALMGKERLIALLQQQMAAMSVEEVRVRAAAEQARGRPDPHADELVRVTVSPADPNEMGKPLHLNVNGNSMWIDTSRPGWLTLPKKMVTGPLMDPEMPVFVDTEGADGRTTTEIKYRKKYAVSIHPESMRHFPELAAGANA